MVKSSGASLMKRKYFYEQKLKSYGAFLMGLQPHSPTLSAAYDLERLLETPIPKNTIIIRLLWATVTFCLL